MSLLLAGGLGTARAAGSEPPPGGAAEAAVEAVAASTPAARGRKIRVESTPISFEFSGDPDQPNLSLMYRIRWDEDEARDFAPELVRGLLNPIGWLRSQFSKGTVLRFYGVRIKPKDLVVEEDASTAAGSGGSSGEEGAPKRRKRLSLRPLWEDVREDLRSEALFAGMELAFPETRQLTHEEKRIMLEAILRVERDRDIPFLIFPAEGVGRLLDISTPTAPPK